MTRKAVHRARAVVATPVVPRAAAELDRESYPGNFDPNKIDETIREGQRLWAALARR